MKDKKPQSHPYEHEHQVEGAIAKVNKAIDALIDLEGSKVFPNGLPSDFSKTLERLRHEQTKLTGIAQNWH